MEQNRRYHQSTSWVLNGQGLRIETPVSEVIFKKCLSLSLSIELSDTCAADCHFMSYKSFHLCSQSLKSPWVWLQCFIYSASCTQIHFVQMCVCAYTCMHIHTHTHIKINLYCNCKYCVLKYWKKHPKIYLHSRILIQISKALRVIQAQTYYLLSASFGAGNCLQTWSYKMGQQSPQHFSPAVHNMSKIAPQKTACLNIQH